MTKTKAAPIPPTIKVPPEIMAGMRDAMGLSPRDTLYKAVAVASGATVGASARSFGAAVRDAGLSGSWADNGKAGMEYNGIRLEGGPPAGATVLPDGTLQFPNAPTGPVVSTAPVDPPRVPSDWKPGQMVRHRNIPAMTPVAILEVLPWTIRLVMQDNGEDKEVQDDWQNYINLALL